LNECRDPFETGKPLLLFLFGPITYLRHVAQAVLRLNGWEIVASVDEQERLAINVADGTASRDELTEWLSVHVERLD
jgi:hypothetical protein